MIFSIEGNIGSGKSTLLEELKDCSFCKPHIIIPEDISSWTNTKDMTNTNILQYFYKDKSKYSYTFQSYVLMSRVHLLFHALQNYTNHIIFIERSHFSDYHMFAETLYTEGYMTEIEWNVYKNYFSMCQSIVESKYSSILYNKASPSTCMARICKRSRTGEELISSSYICKLHEKHESWILTETNSLPYFILNGDLDQTKDIDKRKEELNIFITFVNSIIQD